MTRDRHIASTRAPCGCVEKSWRTVNFAVPCDIAARTFSGPSQHATGKNAGHCAIGVVRRVRPIAEIAVCLIPAKSASGCIVFLTSIMRAEQLSGRIFRFACLTGTAGRNTLKRWMKSVLCMRKIEWRNSRKHCAECIISALYCALILRKKD